MQKCEDFPKFNLLERLSFPHFFSHFNIVYCHQQGLNAVVAASIAVVLKKKKTMKPTQ
jgi:hypothetical protein